MLTIDQRSVGVSETPSSSKRAQKRLFISEGSSSKRNLFRDNRVPSPGLINSGDESDLGPMSPLALSDATPTSARNSPASRFDSPLSSRVLKISGSLRPLDSNLWEKTRQNEGQDAGGSSPFSVLKMLTRSARYSQHRKRCSSSPEIVTTTDKESVEDIIPTTPKRSERNSAWNEAITETPKRRFGTEIQNDMMSDFDVIIAETPQKEDSPDKRLITPLGSVSKEAALPRLHHRKSSCGLTSDGNSSPRDGKENCLKRSARDFGSAAPVSMKLFKSEECLAIPRARAALFQEKKEEFKLSTKSFYSSPPHSLQARDLSVSFEKNEVRRGTKRRSLPTKYNRSRPNKRQKYGEINAGIGHRIRKPKAKKHVSRAEAFKKEKSEEDLSPFSASVPLQNGDSFCNTSADTDSEIPIEDFQEFTEAPASPEPDPGKKFFKTNRTIARHSLATVTVNDSIKLRVSNGKLKLEPNQAKKRLRNSRKKSKISDLSFDANDLTVDDPTFASSINATSVDNILKVLEDDWADDEYDTMEPLIAKHKNAISPLKSSTIPTALTMSPASELSTMTSVMNIKDAGVLNGKIDSHGGKDETEGKKLFPLFNKKYIAHKSLEEASKKISRGNRTPTSWQLGTRRDNQYQLDAGQKRFGATQCTQCGVVYQIGDPDDERSHRNYHDSVRILKFSGWKQERIVGIDPFTRSRIILVEPGDPKHCWKKVSEVLTIVDKDLGLADSKPSDYFNDKIYLYIRNKEIIGVLVAEYVTAGYRMIPNLIDVDCCSAESSAVKCGVKVVWTTMNHRKQGIATKLMDVLRTNYYFGYVLTVDDIAFSIPTPGGKAFAEKYTKTRSFKVYT